MYRRLLVIYGKRSVVRRWINILTIVQINTAINEKIKKATAGTEFESVPMTFEDNSENLLRPSIKVAVENLKVAKLNSNCREKTFTISVTFFAKDMYKCKTDNSKMQELLENALLEDIYVENIYIPLVNLDSDLKDGNLKISFELYISELIPDTDSSEIMESLKFKEEVND